MKKYILLFLTITASSLLSIAQQQLPNASFENWTADAILAYEEPDTWFGTSVSCDVTTSTPVCETTTIKITEAYAGDYAAKLVNLQSEQDGSISPGQLLYSQATNGYVSFTGKPKNLTGYYKFNKTGSDMITIAVTITGASSTDVIAYGTLDLKTTKTDYTLFTLPIQYFSQSAPQNIYVIINFNDNASVNSSFTVDNLVFNYNTTPILSATPVSAAIQFFPNPGKDHIYFDQSVKNISIHSADGSPVLTYAGDSKELNISALNEGIYIISYEYNGLLIHGKLIVE